MAPTLQRSHQRWSPLPPPLRSKTLDLTAKGFSVVAVICWFAWAGLQMGWAGRRPLVPTPSTGNVIPFNNHGIMYVTQRDLDTERLWLLAVVVSFAIVGLCHFIDDRVARGKK